MRFCRLPVLAGTVLAGLLVVGGCADAPAAPGPVASAPVAATAPGGGQAPCTARLRPSAGAGGGGLTLTPEARTEIERLREQPGAQQPARPLDPELASRLDEVGQRVERAARPCADR